MAYITRVMEFVKGKCTMINDLKQKLINVDGKSEQHYNLHNQWLL